MSHLSYKNFDPSYDYMNSFFSWMSKENEPGSVSVFDFLLDKLKNGVNKFESKEEYINQLKNEMKGDPQKTLLYNIYKSTHCKLNTKQKYILFQEIKEFACKISIDDYGMIFNLNKANSFITQIILVIYYKWYHSDYFKPDSKLSRVCKFLRLINNQGYDISTASSIDDNIDASQKYLQIIFKSDRCYGFRTNSINKINFNEEIDINNLIESITKELKIKNTLPKLPKSALSLPDIQKEPHKIISRFLYDMQYYYFDIMAPDACACGLIDRVNLGLEKFPDCMVAIKAVIKQNIFSLRETLRKYKYLTVNNIKNLNQMERYCKETKIWGALQRPVAQIPEINLNKIVKWSCDGSDDYQWLLHIADFSYFMYLKEIDSDISNDMLKNQYNYDGHSQKQVNKLLAKLSSKPEYFIKGYLAHELLHQKQFSSSFIKVLNEILQKYPADMNFCIPQFEYSQLFWKFFKISYCGFQEMTRISDIWIKVMFGEFNGYFSQSYDFQTLLELLTKFDFNTQTIMTIHILGTIEPEIFPKNIFDKCQPKPQRILTPERLFIQVALSDNASQEAQKIKDFMNDNKYVSKIIKSKLMKNYNKDIQELSKMIGKIENLYNFASEWELIDYANMFIEMFLDKFNDETFDEIQSFKDSAPDFIKNPSQVAKFQQIIQEIKKNASIQELTKEIKSLFDESNNNIEEKLYFYGQNCLCVNRIDSEIVSSFSKIDISIPYLVEFQSSPLDIKIFTNIKNPSVSSHLNTDSILIFDDSYVILRIDTKSLPNEEIHIHGDIEFETFIIPVHIQINKEKFIFDYGDDKISFDCLIDEEFNKMKSCDELESIVSVASDLCIKLQLMLQKERTHVLNPMFTKSFAFLKNLHSKIEGNYECNSFIESFNFLSSQIETEERNQIQDPFSFPEAFYEEKDLSNSRIVPQKAILQSSINPTDSPQTTSKQESSENDDSQVEQQVSMPQNQQIPMSQNQSFGFMPQQMNININPDQNNFAYIPLQQIPHLATDFNSGLAMNQQMNTSFIQPQMNPAEFGFNPINFQQAAQQFPNYIPLDQCQFMNQNFNIVGQQMNMFGFEQQNQMNQTIQATNATNIPANMEFSQQDNITIDHNDQTQNQENENEIDEDDSFDDMSGYL